MSQLERDSLTLMPYVGQISARAVLERKVSRWTRAEPCSFSETFVIGDMLWRGREFYEVRCGKTTLSVTIPGDAGSRHIAFCGTYSLICGPLTANRRRPAPMLIDGGMS